MRARADARAGYTMVEMLTVIAIIGILAALLFPLGGRVRARSRQTACISNMKQIYQSLHQYKLDEADFPPAIFGYVANGTPYLFVASTAKARTAGQLKCPDNPETDPDALYRPVPNQQPYVDVNRAMQVATDPLARGGQFQGVNSYDGQFENPNIPGGNYVLHYSRFRPTSGPNDPDFARQLSNRQAPDDTVVTWCNYHGQSTGEGVVLFLGGDTQTFPIRQVVEQGWRIRHKGG